MFVPSGEFFFKLQVVFNLFFRIRGFKLRHINLFQLSYLEGSVFFKNRFFTSPYTYVSLVITSKIQLSYKLTLKSIIKNSYNLPICKLIVLFNHEISFWNQKGPGGINSIAINKELDLYLYKLLWRYVKRRHPRRCNTWIYKKYWKNISGVWKFFSYDPSSTSLVFIISHQFSRQLYFLPSLFNEFDLLNFNKFFSLYFKRARDLFKGLFRILFIKQRASCYKCKQRLKPSSVKLVNLIGMRSKISYPILLHNYCFWFY